MQQNGLQLGAEVDIFPAASEIQGFDPHVIAHQNQPLFRLRPERRGEHPAEPAKRIDVPFKKRVQNGFGVAARVEPVARPLQVPAQLHMVVDLAVEDQNGVAIVAGHGLVAVLQIDDLEPNGAQRNVARFPHALLIGAAMDQRSSDLPDPVRIRAFLEMCKSGDPAHVLNNPRSLPQEHEKRTAQLVSDEDTTPCQD